MQSVYPYHSLRCHSKKDIPYQKRKLRTLHLFEQIMKILSGNWYYTTFSVQCNVNAWIWKFPINFADFTKFIPGRSSTIRCITAHPPSKHLSQISNTYPWLASRMCCEWKNFTSSYWNFTHQVVSKLRSYHIALPSAITHISLEEGLYKYWGSTFDSMK